MIINQDNAEAILKQLVEDNKLTEEDLKKALFKSPSESTKRSVDIIHTLLCAKQHSSRECSYYQEEELDYCWTSIDHQLWLGRTLILADELGLKDEKDLKHAVTFTRTVSNIISNALHSNPLAVQFLFIVIDQNRRALLPAGTSLDQFDLEETALSESEKSSDQAEHLDYNQGTFAFLDPEVSDHPDSHHAGE